MRPKQIKPQEQAYDVATHTQLLRMPFYSLPPSTEEQARVPPGSEWSLLSMCKGGWLDLSLTLCSLSDAVQLVLLKELVFT